MFLIKTAWMRFFVNNYLIVTHYMRKKKEKLERFKTLLSKRKRASKCSTANEAKESKNALERFQAL